MSYNEAYWYWHFGGICHLQITSQSAVGPSDMFVSHYMTSRPKEKKILVLSNSFIPQSHSDFQNGNVDVLCTVLVVFWLVHFT
jgi:hypothetical protein